MKKRIKYVVIAALAFPVALSFSDSNGAQRMQRQYHSGKGTRIEIVALPGQFTREGNTGTSELRVGPRKQSLFKRTFSIAKIGLLSTASAIIKIPLFAIKTMKASWAAISNVYIAVGIFSSSKMLLKLMKAAFSSEEGRMLTFIDWSINSMNRAEDIISVHLVKSFKFIVLNSTKLFFKK